MTKPAAKRTAKTKAQGAAAVTVAKHLDISRQRVNQLTDDGLLPKFSDGSFDLDACRVAYIRWIRDETRKSSAAQNQSRVQEARAREIEIRIAREEGRLVEMEDVEAVVADILGTYRSELSGLPAACTRDLSLRGTIEKQLNGAIDRCRAKFEKAERALRAGREVELDGDEAGA